MIDEVKEWAAKGVSMEGYAGRLVALKAEITKELGEVNSMLLEEAQEKEDYLQWTITEWASLRSSYDDSYEWTVRAQVPGRPPIYVVRHLSHVALEQSSSMLRALQRERDDSILQLLNTPQLQFSGLAPRERF